MNLEKLDMKGCRGDARVLERKIWEAVRKNRQEQTRIPKPQASRSDIAKTVHELHARVKKIVERIRTLESELQGLRSEADALRKQAAELLESAARTRASGQTSKGKGAVTQADVDGEVILISLGEEDGVKPGARFIVHRGDQHVSTIQIREVRKGESEGFSVKNLQKETVRVGDRLMGPE